MKKENILIIAVVGVLLVGGFVIFNKTERKDTRSLDEINEELLNSNKNISTEKIPAEISDEVVAEWEASGVDYLKESENLPEGWYSHRKGKYLLINTKQEELPETRGAEYFAYGEQIMVNLVKLEETPEEWASSYVSEPENDPMTISKKWSTLNGHKLLQVEGEAGGAGGKTFTNYVFVDGYWYSFSLYPLERTHPESESPVRNEEGLKALDIITKSYF